MRHASLFSGTGGFDLAAEWMGWTNVFNCEIDKFCQKVLKYHFPDAIQLGDIKQLKFKRDDRGNVYIRRDGITENPLQSGCVQREFNEEGAEIREQWNACTGDKDRIHIEQEEETWQNIGTVDILSGGFPCQPFSMAGKRRGTDDDRHLWPEMLRAIREIKPRWVVGENVYGFTNWSGGMVFREVLSDLENEGYEVQPFIIPACAINAPHRRDRVWIVAYRSTGDSQPGDAPSQVKCECTFKGRENTGSGVAGGQDICAGIGETGDNGSGHIQGCQNGDAADTKLHGHDANAIEERQQPGGRGTAWSEPSSPCNEQIIADTGHTGYERGKVNGSTGECRAERNKQSTGCICPNWTNFPTQSPLRGKYDGFSDSMDRNWNIIHKYYATIREICGNKDLRNLQATVQTEAFWESFRGLHEIFDKEVLLKVLQSIERSTEVIEGVQSWDTSEIFEKVVPNLRKHIQSSDSSHRRKLDEQLGEQYSDLMCIMPYEIALAVMEIQAQYKAFYSKLRNESIKAYGNAIVPQVAFELFKAIEQYEIKTGG